MSEKKTLSRSEAVRQRRQSRTKAQARPQKRKSRTKRTGSYRELPPITARGVVNDFAIERRKKAGKRRFNAAITLPRPVVRSLSLPRVQIRVGWRLLSFILVLLFGTGLYLFSVLVYRTCRFQIEGLNQLQSAKKNGKSVVLTSWHGMTMMVAAMIRKHMDITNVTAICPDDHRGDTLVIFSRKLGADPIPIDLSGNSTLSMGKKLVDVIRKIKAGMDFLIHPDGPAGPAYKVKRGVSYVAQKTEAPILPLGCYCRNAFHVPRWDRYTLPLPFSKIHIQLGSLISVPTDLSDLTAFNLDLEDTLNKLTLQAAANYYQLGD